MQSGDVTLVWILFWLFAAIATVATFLITKHHRSRRAALISGLAMLVFFVALFIALRLFLRSLGI